MRRVSAALAVIAAVLGIGAWAASGPGGADAHKAAVFVSSDMRGYLGPCGCSENMRGGIPRAAHQLKEARRGGVPVFYVDAGDSLFGQAKLEPERVPQEERKARALAEAFRLMKLDARTSGEKDDARGAAFRRALGLPELASGEVKLLDANGHRIAIAAGADAKALTSAAQKARAKGAVFVIGLLHQTLQAAQAAAQRDGLGVDVVVLSHTESETAGEENRVLRGKLPVIQVQSKGRSLLRLDLVFEGGDSPFEQLTTAADVERELKALDQRVELLNKQINLPGLDPKAKALRQQKLSELISRRESLAAKEAPTATGKNAFSIRFIPLEATLPSDDEARAIVTAYDRDVGKLNLSWARKHGRDCPSPTPGRAAFVGSNACRTCHAPAFPVWEKSKHAHAYETLEAQGKQYHLDCIGCHVTGINKPGGVCRIDKVEGREHVGCESCHGPGSLHAKAPGKRNISRANTPDACVGCHDPENSPHFEFRTYLPQILGPGHGADVP
ncbi:MAG: multiheme c-type cytochrome [Myxococcaceae bacterium]